MTFLRADLLRAVPDGFSVGGHLLEMHPESRSGAWWQLRCGGCLAQLDEGEVPLDGPLLAGAQTIPAAGGLHPVTWAWGATPSAPPAAGLASAPAELIFVRGVPRQPVLAPAYPIGSGAWVAAAPGWARTVVAAAPGRVVQRRPERLVLPACPSPAAGARR